MATEFIGYTVLVTLTNPPNAKLQGIVANVAGQQLALRDVTLLWNGQRFPSYIIDSTRIADLEVAPARRDENNVLPAAAPNASQAQWASARSSELSADDQGPGHIQNAAPTAFVDPAILSYAKPRPDPPTASTLTSGDAHHPVASPVMIADSTHTTTPTTVVFQGMPQRNRADSGATATLTEPFDSSALKNNHVTAVLARQDGAVHDREDVESVIIAKGSGKKGKKAGRKAGKSEHSQTGPGIIDVRDLKSSPTFTKKVGKGKGWRQTPIIEETSPKKSRHARNKRSMAEDANGWATEDATDIQDMGDFDFESNLSKFDKRRVFDDIRSKDKTADEERLVSFNRKAKPGTSGGKNLHYTENVLDDPQNTPSQWKSEAGETEEDEVHEERYSSSRASRREPSKSRKAPASRKGSAILNSSHSASILTRTASSRTGSPRPSTNRIGASASPVNGSFSRGIFRMASTNKPCTTVTPLQMLEVEQVCTAELGLTEDMLTENAARGISDVALRKTGVQVPNGNILVLVGNHKSGARAIAASRHLRNRSMRVTVCILGSDREDSLLESVRKQLNIYKRGGGRVANWDELQPQFGEWTPHVIIDALLGMHVAFEDLRLDHQATTYEMIRWINRSKVHILSIDVPSGLIASTGEVTQTDSGPLITFSTNIICLGAPKACLLDALARDKEAREWKFCIVDIGISVAAWKKYGTRRRHGVEFGKEWAIDLSYQA